MKAVEIAFAVVSLFKISSLRARTSLCLSFSLQLSRFLVLKAETLDSPAHPVDC